MRNRWKRFFAILGLLGVSLILGSGLTRSQALQQYIIYGVLNNHYQYHTLDDAYSERVFHLYLKRLDPSKRFFTAEDISNLSLYKYAIDDEIESGTFEFFNTVQKMYGRRLNTLSKSLPDLFKTTISFNNSTELELDRDKRSYLDDETTLSKYWKQLFTYQVLSQYINLKESKTSANVLLLDTLEPELKKESKVKIEGEFTDSLTRLLDESEEDHRNLYLDSLINVFDTHTNYFPAEKKEDFDINISGKLEGIGAVLREEDGFIKVVRIVPGSASWKQGALKAEDLILKVAQENEDPVDIVGARVRDAVHLIRGKKGTVVTLTVKHITGDIVDIPITRDIVVIEETYSKHAVIEDARSNKRFGYISLPKFYRDFKNSQARNTTDDIRDALTQLRFNNVDGILLDLRNNEGGALVDAVYTAGLFIKDGPIVQVKGRSPMHSILKDRDRSIVYDGPLVVLINAYSASASEILAAALQDYKRAVIVGSPSFGKGTVQTFYDLNQTQKRSVSYFDKLGSLKLTIQKFYRINGGSTQHKGVIPDIMIDDTYSHLEIGERHLDNALPWDTVSALRFSVWKKSSFDIKKLALSSQKRLQSLPAYTSLLSHIQFIKKRTKDTRVPLNISTAIEKRNRSNTKSDSYTESIKGFDSLSIQIPQKKTLSPAQKESYKDWKKGLKKDLYIFESCAILSDLVDME